MLGFVLALRKQRLFKCLHGSVEGRDKAAPTSTVKRWREAPVGWAPPRRHFCDLRVHSSGGVERAGQRKGCRDHTTRLGLESTNVRGKDWERNLRHRKGEGICVKH